MWYAVDVELAALLDLPGAEKFYEEADQMLGDEASQYGPEVSGDLFNLNTMLGEVLRHSVVAEAVVRDQHGDGELHF